MKKLKKSRQQIIKKLKSQQTGIKKNITFRLDESLLERLDHLCEKEGLKKVDVIEELLKEFLG